MAARPAAASAAAMRLRAVASTCSARRTQHGQRGEPLAAIASPAFPGWKADGDRCRGRDEEGGYSAAAASTGHYPEYGRAAVRGSALRPTS